MIKPFFDSPPPSKKELKRRVKMAKEVLPTLKAELERPARRRKP
jgi:hypothetical protein